jgi:hypothetical protein
MTDLPPILIVIIAVLAAFGLCLVIGGVMAACSKPEPKPNFGFDNRIPEDREFTDPLTDSEQVGTVAPRGPSHPSSRSNPSSFPQDHSYQSAPAKRF